VHTLNKHSHSREHHKKDTQNRYGHATLLETGLVYFFYRPKKRVESDPDHRPPQGLDDISRLYVLLAPKGGNPRVPNEWVKLSQAKGAPPHKRLLVIPRKKLPSIDQHQRLLGVVAKVGNLHDVRKVLAEDSSKATGDHRQIAPEVRAVGEGVYGIVEHQLHTHLAFVLELPHEPGEVQRCFNIPKEGSYHIVVRNPDVSPPSEEEKEEAEHLPFGREQARAMARNKEARIERDIRAYLEGLAPLPEEPAERPPPHPTTPPTFIPVNPPTLLDNEGAQVILVGAAAKLDEELGRPGRMLQELESIDERYFLRSDSKPFEELHLHKRSHRPTLLSDEWE